ncbi:MAG: DNA cytosine methyltransferase [Polyangiaceae bacterium]
MTRRKKLLSVDLFCGAGGFSEGFRQAGVHTVAANDIDAWAGATYANNHPDTAFVLGDITDPEVKKKLLAIIDGRQIDIVAGGPPCQAFSQVRNHDRVTDDPRNALYQHFLSMVSTIVPKAFVMENVVGMRNLEGGKVGEQILKDLSLGGAYRVRWSVLDTADFGVPQTRRRVVAIGIRRDFEMDPPVLRSPLADERMELVRMMEGREGSVRYELPSEQTSLLSPTRSIVEHLLDRESLNYVSVEQAIGDLVGLEPCSTIVRKPSDDAEAYPSAPTSAYQRLMRAGSSAVFNLDVPSIREDTVKRLAAIPQGGNYRDIPEKLQARYLNGKRWGPDVGRAKLSRKHYYAYRKLHPDFFSWTLNTKTDCVYHYEDLRALSVREFARLHSFPDAYAFLNGDRHSRYAQIGNAVPPLLAKALAEHLVPLLQPADTSPPRKRASQRESVQLS